MKRTFPLLKYSFLVVFPFSILLILATGCREVQDLRQIKQIQDNRISQLSRSLEQKVVEYDALQKQNRDNEHELTGLREDVAELTDSLTKTQNDLKTAQDQVKSLGGELTTKDQSLTQTQQTLDEQSKKAQSLADEVSKSQTAYLKAQDTLKSTEQQIKDKDAEIEKLKANLDEARKQADSLEKSNKELTAQLDESKASAEKARAESEGLKEKAKQSADSESVGDEGQLAEAYDLLSGSLKPVVDANMAGVSKTKHSVVVRLSSDYLFKGGVTDLDPEVKPALDQIAAILAKYPEKYVEVQGHTDSQAVKNSPFADNWALASARADKIVRYLANNTSLSPEHLKSSSASQYRPVKSGSSGKMDRRVEIILTDRP